jgi:serine/threonine protein kinase
MDCQNGHRNADGAAYCSVCGSRLLAQLGVGQLLGGRYRIVDRLGEGGMGVVFAAEQALGSATRKVAIKTLHPELSGDPTLRERFEREVATIAQLEHPNTVRVYDFGATPEGMLFIVMEFLAGEPSSAVIRREGALAPGRVAHLLRQIAGSLDEAHGRGIVHRDLKPDPFRRSRLAADVRR